ncbi:2729_t:CDS:2 [Funneliformis mosseae]|uniref:2729_t:CDS:1 n=1 Tax=Funneliformis mosseae TaxID=27381 RepID=A0A9N9DFC4_FUNMO|nr:2729_t:CDS:2 [Funneliformis mosseae]
MKQAEAARDTYLVERYNALAALVAAINDLNGERTSHKATKAERDIVIDERNKLQMELNKLAVIQEELAIEKQNNQELQDLKITMADITTQLKPSN